MACFDTRRTSSVRFSMFPTYYSLLGKFTKTIGKAMMKRAVTCVVAALAPLIAHAGCSENLQNWFARLHPGQVLDAAHAVCKVWPANNALTIGVLPLEQKSSSDGLNVVDIEVLVADTATGAIVAHRFQRSAIHYGEDHYFDGVEIDTARYQLTSTQRAFGVRLKSSGGPPADMSGIATLSLYLIDGQHLHPVLDRLIVSDWTGDRDGPCTSTSETSRTLALGPAGTQGYAVLQVAEKYVESESRLEVDTCSGHTSPAQRRKVMLDYRDGTYRIPDAMRYAD
ncbi:TPA: hypothetical protein QDC27_005635 [Burkholderia cepacia ATCC 25416]|uniref:hypothetical protein n=1 Tax=Burkholderia cepacia TaxID=292 RepID=UPI000F604306|nr:hypothetical protein [Burkholderia cepacia]HDR9770364.1 hypothetical protein [Burkholderia cepacia ATCC 25416]MCA8024961.1 hypothetical protein [Burkholderia cepacia]MCA8077502.1 hypothetical protein [Burkholderia cepacia]HDR9777795.1 hypothetical protein [Burkholderia cepacia ATCC 25416]HDR9786217.1 hypothetical protein [Burkholderia cepacia ATCC 25416]